MKSGLMILAASLCLAATPPPSFEPERIYDPLNTVDQEAMARRLLLHVALLEIQINDSSMTVWGENPRTGYGAVIAKDRIVCLSTLLEGASKITIVGPKGRQSAKILMKDEQRRVAILAPDGSLDASGLYPVTAMVPLGQRKVDMTAFALVSTLELAGVSQGVLTHRGVLREYQGHPRIDLKLTRGMPVFDRRARLLGYSRVVAWDTDRYMLISPEQIRSARTSTAAHPPPAQQKNDKRPWWGK